MPPSDPKRIQNVAHPPDDPREKAMIEAFMRGDMAGFKYVYSKYRQRIFSYCLYYMSNEQLAEDAFQEVFTRAYTRRDQLRESKALKSWLLLITRSVCLNMLRTSKFTPEFVSISGSDSDNESDSYREPKELSVQPQESLVADDMLKMALAKLAPIYREAFLLREFEGYEWEEIAEITNTSVMNVKVRITRAKKRLRMLLAPYYSRTTSGRSEEEREPARSSAAFEDEPATQDSDDLEGPQQEVFAV